MMDYFATSEIQTGETGIFVRSSGSGPPVLLLHGFPQTHLMWRSVAPPLSRAFTVVWALFRRLPRSSGLRAQRLPALRPGPRAVREAGYGRGHGDRHGAARVSALLGPRTRPRRSRRLPHGPRSPGARRPARRPRRPADGDRVGPGRR